jgi:hypothetical protein
MHRRRSRRRCHFIVSPNNKQILFRNADGNTVVAWAKVGIEHVFDIPGSAFMPISGIFPVAGIAF